MPLVVETGEGIQGANSLASPAFIAGFHADRGTLPESSTLTATDLTFAAAGTVSSATFAAVVGLAGSIVRFAGTAQAANSGFAYVVAVAAPLVTLAWLEPVDEAAGASVTVTVYAKEGWWGTRQRLEASAINGTEYLRSVAWYGEPVNDVQGTPFPRTGLFVRRGSPYYAQGLELPSDEVPVAVAYAVSHLALEDLTESVNEVVRPSRQLKSKTVGPISKTFDRPRALRSFPYVDRALRGLRFVPSPFKSLGGPV